MARAPQYNSLKSLANLFAISAFTLTLLGCSGFGGLATGSKEGEGGGNQGGALDEFNQGGRVAGLDNSGDGPGGLTGPGGFNGPGGSMTGGGAVTPPGAGGASGPFDNATGGGNNAAGGGSSGECSGSVCSSDTPVGSLFGKVQISVSLFPDPDTQGGNCNDLFGPPVEREVCRRADASPRSGALAMPKTIDGGEGEPLCSTVTVQPPIDPNLIPKVEMKADRPFYSYSTTVYDKTFNARCAASGKWLVESEVIVIPFSPYPTSNNTWTFTLDALYPQNGAWESRGTRTLTMRCGWDTTTAASVKCAEEVPSPLGNIQAVPIQGTLRAQ